MPRLTDPNEQRTTAHAKREMPPSLVGAPIVLGMFAVAVLLLMLSGLVAHRPI